MRPSLLIALVILILAPACKKEPGDGGRAEIRGVVLRQEVNAVGVPIGDPYPYLDTRVYIMYGDHDFADDDVRTGPAGVFVFPWMRRGDYTIYTIGEQCKCADDRVVVSATVHIDGKKDVVVVPTLIAKNY